MKEDYINNYDLDMIKTIGIMGTDNVNKTSELIYHLLIQSNISTALISRKYTEINKNKIKLNIFNFKEVKKYLYRERVQVLIVEIPVDYMENKGSNNIRFDIIVHTNIQIDKSLNPTDLDKYIKLQQKFFKGLSDREIAVINADDDKGLKLLGDNRSTPVVTYGLSNRSTITASSIDMYDFNYCIQRTITTLLNEDIEACEYPMSNGQLEKYNIYNNLGAITCLLLIGIDIKDINRSLKNIKGWNLRGYKSKRIV